MMGAGGCRPPPPEYKLNVTQNMGMCQTQFPAQGYMPPARQSLPQGAQSRRPIQQQPIPPSGKNIFEKIQFEVKLILKINVLNYLQDLCYDHKWPILAVEVQWQVAMIAICHQFKET